MTAPARGRRRVVPAGPRIEARARAAQAARRRRWWRRGAWAAGGVLVSAAALWVVLASSWLAVHRVSVVGTRRLAAAQVTAAAGVTEGTPLARVDVAAVARRVRGLPAVESVVVSRDWPTGLRITVVERTALAAVLADGRWTLVDRFGVGFASSPTQPPGLVRLQVLAVGPADPATRAALAVLGQLTPGLRAQVAVVRAASPIAVSLGLRDGREVVWGAPTDAATKAAAVTDLLRLPGTVIDVSAPGVAIRR